MSDYAGHVVLVHVAATDVAIDSAASVFISDLLPEYPELLALDVLAEDPLSPPLGADDALAWRQAHDLDQLVAWDETERFGADWAETSLTPTLVLIDLDGMVLARIHEQYPQQLPAVLDTAFSTGGSP